MKSLSDTYCIQVGDLWCAVLGDYYPNYSDGSLKHTVNESWCTQRLCDQNNVSYKCVVVRSPTCPECLRIKQLMVELKRNPDLEDEDEEDGQDYAP